ncbi:MAG: hypothetical protein AB8B86_04205 [Pseudomonadales bacterium]
MSYRNAEINWNREEYNCFGLAAQINRHTYHELTLFDKETLIDLLDSFPRKWLQAFTMGTDPVKNDEWHTVDIDKSTSGADMYRAVEQGRLWLNVTHVEEASTDYADLIEGMYEHLGEHCKHLRGPKADYSTLLISSPGAQVYYHMDAEPNMLWHMRGEKNIWVYPEMDTQYVPQHLIEDIYAGEIDENLPYDPSFDEQAFHHVLQPGEVASWPHNGPHRIQNIDMNVSLATSYYTPMIYKRQYVQLANRFILRNLGVSNRSMNEEGAIPSCKRMAYRAISKVLPFKKRSRSANYITDLQIDPDSPLGMRKLAEKKPASFSQYHAK